jgi:hypothetical protein
MVREHILHLTGHRSKRRARASTTTQPAATFSLCIAGPRVGCCAAAAGATRHLPGDRDHGGTQNLSTRAGMYPPPRVTYIYLEGQ